MGAPLASFTSDPPTFAIVLDVHDHSLSPLLLRYKVWSKRVPSLVCKNIPFGDWRKLNAKHHI